MVNQPQVKKVLGEVALCTKMAVFDAKKFAEFSGKGAAKGAGKKEGKAEKAPKQEKTPKEKTPRKEAEVPMDDEPAKPKEKDPFAAFPKSTFIFDEFKRVYSNEDIKTKAIPYFWENLDKENFSIW